MAQKKATRVYRTNLVNVGLGQGQLKTIPYLFSVTENYPDGLIRSRSTYAADGTLNEGIQWEYDEKGQVLCEKYFTDENEPSEIIRYERDTDGRILRDIKKYLDGSEDITTYSYDGNGHLTGKLTLDEEGNLYSREEFNWEGNNLTFHRITDTENNETEKEEFKYDQNGNVLEQKRRNLETGENTMIVTEYDQNNRKTGEKLFDGDDNLMESISYTHDQEGTLLGTANVTPQKNSHTRYFYDNHGNHTGQEETDEEGNRLLWVEHTYDDNNDLANSVVFVNGGLMVPGQHYELNYEYEWYQEEIIDN
jgi:YD repeat-containing protein